MSVLPPSLTLSRSFSLYVLHMYVGVIGTGSVVATSTSPCGTRVAIAYCDGNLAVHALCGVDADTLLCLHTPRRLRCHRRGGSSSSSAALSSLSAASASSSALGSCLPPASTSVYASRGTMTSAAAGTPFRRRGVCWNSDGSKLATTCSVHGGFTVLRVFEMRGSGTASTTNRGRSTASGSSSGSASGSASTSGSGNGSGNGAIAAAQSSTLSTDVGVAVPTRTSVPLQLVECFRSAPVLLHSTGCVDVCCGGVLQQRDVWAVNGVVISSPV